MAKIDSRHTAPARLFSGHEPGVERRRPSVAFGLLGAVAVLNVLSTVLSLLLD